MHLYCNLLVSSSVVLTEKVSINIYLSLLEICLLKFPKLKKFAFSEVSATQLISQRFATFCNVIATFAAIFLVFATFLQLLPHYFLFLQRYCNLSYLSQLSYLQLLAKCFKFANFIHCIYYAKVLPCNLLHGFNLRNTVVFIITEFFLKSKLLLKVQWSS